VVDSNPTVRTRKLEVASWNVVASNRQLPSKSALPHSPRKSERKPPGFDPAPRETRYSRKFVRLIAAVDEHIGSAHRGVGA
jgi:hypothetical protein